MPRPGRGVGQGTPSTPLGGGSRSVLGSTLSFFGAPPMACRRNENAAEEARQTGIPFPFEAKVWDQLVELLELAPQQARIVERILRGMGDKQIARDLGLSVSTVRTYLSRIFVRIHVRDRVQLILRVFAEARSLAERECHQE